MPDDVLVKSPLLSCKVANPSIEPNAEACVALLREAADVDNSVALTELAMWVFIDFSPSSPFALPFLSSFPSFLSLSLFSVHCSTSTSICTQFSHTYIGDLGIQPDVDTARSLLEVCEGEGSIYVGLECCPSIYLSRAVALFSMSHCTAEFTTLVGRLQRSWATLARVAFFRESRQFSL